MHGIKWIQNQNHTWHAWPLRGQSTYCGRIDTHHLRRFPAAAITDLPDADGRICKACGREARYVKPPMIGGDAIAAAWTGLISRHLTHSRIKVSEHSVSMLAVKLAEIGSPSEPEARELFTQLQVILLKPTWIRKTNALGRTTQAPTLPGLKESLEAIGNTPGALRTVAQALSAWQAATGRDLHTEKFNAARVMGTMLQIPDPARYVAHLLTSRLVPTLAAMFHPNTLERAKRDTALRGMFAGSSQYWDSTSSQLHIIRD